MYYIYFDFFAPHNFQKQLTRRREKFAPFHLFHCKIHSTVKLHDPRGWKANAVKKKICGVTRQTI